MHFFGLFGTFMMIFGFASAVYVGFNKLNLLAKGIRAPLVTDNPYFYLALVCMIIGVQLFLTGFVAELVSRNSTERNKYFIEKRTFEQELHPNT